MDKLSSIVTRELFYRKLPVEDLFPRYVVVMHSDKHRSIDAPPSLPHQKGKMFAGEGEDSDLRGASGAWSRVNPRFISPFAFVTHILKVAMLRKLA